VGGGLEEGRRRPNLSRKWPMRLMYASGRFCKR
jgi:hypothetical protein